MKELLEQMKEALENAISENEKFEGKRVAAAGPRARKLVLELEKIGKNYRKLSLELQKDMKASKVKA